MSYSWKRRLYSSAIVFPTFRQKQTLLCLNCGKFFCEKRKNTMWVYYDFDIKSGNAHRSRLTLIFWRQLKLDNTKKTKKKKRLTKLWYLMENYGFYLATITLCWKVGFSASCFQNVFNFWSKTNVQRKQLIGSLRSFSTTFVFDQVKKRKKEAFSAKSLPHKPKGSRKGDLNSAMPLPLDRHRHPTYQIHWQSSDLSLPPPPQGLILVRISE